MDLMAPYLQAVSLFCTALIMHKSTGKPLPEFSLEIILATLFIFKVI